MRVDNFRNDINGLRAYAIVFVVLYHFNIPLFKAGFIGVDVFFVISGFLMTKIIASGLIQHNFHFGAFFASRFIRIIPPVILLVLAVFFINLFILTPVELREYAKYSIKALSFTSNFSLLKDANNYFSSVGQENLLLHTWSLSVEWQFYLIYPFILWIGFKFTQSLKKITLLVAALFILSLAACIVMTERNQFYAFYMLVTRAWEMLAGGLVFLFKAGANKAAASAAPFYAGVLALLMSLILFDDRIAWPGYCAALTVAGTALIIYAERQASFLFSGKWLSLIGLSSYSIYLWHWPVRYFLYYAGTKLGTFYTVCAVMLSFAIGLLSYFVLEKRLFSWFKSKKRLTSMTVICLSLAVMISVSDFTRKSSGFPWRGGVSYMAAIEHLALPNPKNGWCFYTIASTPSLTVGKEGVECHIGATEEGGKKALLFGDSYAGQYLPLWDALGRKTGLDIQAVTTNWCNPSDGEDFFGPKTSRAYEQCLYNRHYVTENIQNYDYIILGGSWSKNFSSPDTVKGLEHIINLAKGKKIIIMAEPYQFNADVGELYKRSVWKKERFDISPYMDALSLAGMKNADDILDKLSQTYSNILYLTRDDLFDKSQYANRDVPYSLDGGHISVLGSVEAEKFFSSHAGRNKLEAFLSN